MKGKISDVTYEKRAGQIYYEYTIKVNMTAQEYKDVLQRNKHPYDDVEVLL